MSAYDTFGSGAIPDDDPNGTAADACDLADDQAEHPERYNLTTAVDDPFEVPFAMPKERVNVCDCEARE